MKITKPLSILTIALSAAFLTGCEKGGAIMPDSPTAEKSANQVVAPSKDSIVAVVNGESISELDIAPLLGQMPKSVAVDNYINKVIIAQHAKGDKKINEIAEQKITAIKRDVLMSAYLDDFASTTQKATTEKEISDYFAKNVSDEMFSTYEASYTLFVDEKSANEGVKGLLEGEKKALANLKSFTSNDGKISAFTRDQFPYGLGSIVSQLKDGDISKPLATRSGFFVVRLDKTIKGKKPELKEVQEQISQIIANNKLEASLTSLRKAAKIELK